MPPNNTSLTQRLLPLLLAILLPGLGHVFLQMRSRAVFFCFLLLIANIIGAIATVLFANSPHLYLIFTAKYLMCGSIYLAQIIDLAFRSRETSAKLAPIELAKRCAGFILASVLFVLLPIRLIDDLSVRSFAVPLTSMAPTLRPNDIVLVDLYSWLQRSKKSADLRGQVMLFLIPKVETSLSIKRVVANPGDKIAIKDTIIYVNGNAITSVPANESAQDFNDIALTPGDRLDQFSFWQESLDQRNYRVLHEKESESEFSSYPEVTVPPEHYFVLGDHRSRSHDSRMWGFLPAENIVGYVRQILYSGELWHSTFTVERAGRLVR